MNFAIIISGCGVYDGAEIQETVMTMLAVTRNGGSYQLFAPNVQQHHVINHLTGEVTEEKRNVLVESARIARGNIKPLKEFDLKNFDAIIFPGGFGVAKNLFTYAIDGTECKVDNRVEKVITETHAAGKPIGALCISPVLISRVLKGVTVTIGSDPATASDIGKLGGTHIVKGNGEVFVDKKNRIVTNPCYMIDGTIEDIFTGADNCVKALIKLIKES